MGANAIPMEQMLTIVCSAIVYPGSGGNTGGVTFLSNIGTTPATLQWEGSSYAVPAWSVSFIDNASGQQMFNTAVGPWTLPEEEGQEQGSLEPQLIHRPHHHSSQHKRPEPPVAAFGDASFACIPDTLGLWRPQSELYYSAQPLEQIATTQDTTDYLLYSTNVTLESGDLALGSTEITLSNVGDYAIIQLSQPGPTGGAPLTSVAYMTAAVSWGASWKAALAVPASAGWTAGPVVLNILSQTLGLINFGPFLESQWAKALHTPICCRPSSTHANHACSLFFRLRVCLPCHCSFCAAYQRGLVPGNSSILFGSSGSPVDLGSNGWLMQVGLAGEDGAGNYSTLPSSSPLWMPTPSCAPLIARSNLVWFRVQLSLALDADPDGVYALDLLSMGKGAVWANGHALGRYWLVIASSEVAGDCNPASCSYIGAYSTDSCRTGCGEPTQRFYHVPRAWLRDGVNEITMLEENPGSRPDKVSIVRMN